MTIDRTTMVLALGALAFTAPAFAQGGSSGPSGLFGATRPGSQGRQVLTLQLAVSESFDSDVAPEFRTRLSGGRLPGRRSNVAAAAIDFARNRRAIQFSAAATGFVRYSYDVGQMRAGAASARVGAGLRMPGRAGILSLSQGLSYSPSYFYQLLPDDAIDAEPDAEPPLPANPEYRIEANESVAYRTRLRLQTGTGLGWRTAATAEHAQTDFGQNIQRGERRIWDGSVRASYHRTRRGSVSFGYRYRESSYGGGDTSQVHEVPVGFDFTPPLTPLRRLTFRVQVSPTVMLRNAVGPAASESDTSVDDDGTLDAIETSIPVDRRRRYAVQGEVGVSYPLSLRWHLSTAYQRRIQTLALLSEPVATHGTRLRVAGVMGRRVDVALQARFTQGASAAGLRGNNLTAAQGSARLRFALTRSVALSAEYLYYRYDFGGQLLAPDLPSFLQRHSLRAGISMFTQPLGR